MASQPRGRHIIIVALPKGGHARLGGVFTDDEFFALPVISEFGALPHPYAAAHFGAENDAFADSWLSLPRLPDEATEVLRLIDRHIYSHRYAVLVGDDSVWSTHSSLSSAEAKLRTLAAYWRRGEAYDWQDPLVQPGWYRTKYTAPKFTRSAREETGDGKVAYRLRERRRGGRGNGLFARVVDQGLRAYIHPPEEF